MSIMLDVEREHPLYKANKKTWSKYRDLYAGGEQFISKAWQYLIRRHKEPADVYAERLERVFYENYIGSIIDWYASTVFRREPILTFDTPNAHTKRFFAELVEDCDRQGTGITDFFRKCLIETLVCGVCYVLVDFPKAERPLLTRAEEMHLGQDRAYLVLCPAEELINWCTDEDGRFEWVVLRKSYFEPSQKPPGEWVESTSWVYYDRFRYLVYRRHGEANEREKPELVSSGTHGLARSGKVPLFAMRVSEGLWLANKAASLQLEHFNKSNALSWALTMGLFASPVIYSEREFNQIVGESYYIQLGPEDRFGWTEPEGHVYQIAAENLTRLKDEIYRVCYVMTQAGGGLSAGVPQSGWSKQRDYTITQEVLRAYGDLVKDAMKKVLGAVAEARGDEVQIGVSGLDEFDIGDFSSELDDGMKLLSLAPNCKILKREVLRKLALKYLCDLRQEVKDAIVSEIYQACEKD